MELSLEGRYSKKRGPRPYLHLCIGKCGALLSTVLLRATYVGYSKLQPLVCVLGSYVHGLVNDYILFHLSYQISMMCCCLGRVRLDLFLFWSKVESWWGRWWGLQWRRSPWKNLWCGTL